MITLNIKEKGHLIEIPGMPSFRTPATIDISKGDIRSIVGYLKVCDINDYEIIATNQTTKEVYKSSDFNPPPTPKVVKKKDKQKINIENRIDKLEKMILDLSEKSSDDSEKKVEQTTKQLMEFQTQVLHAIKNIHITNVSEKTIMEELADESESVDPFIPDINTEGMKIKSRGDHKTITKEDADTDAAADALSKLLK